jgi:crotonobetainyl-CoA:carnitine CoA-transferase CaiB-like acyl-CoA transferase
MTPGGAPAADPADPAAPGPLAGVRVVEVATHVYVPMAGAVLAEWGADVVKVEHPVTGDPYRGLVTAGLHPVHDGVDPYFQAANRGKRSVALDLRRAGGRDVLARLLAGADVFLTNLRPGARARLRIEVDDVRADNPALVYGRGSAFGPVGPDAGRGGYDTGAYWARTGMQHLVASPRDAWPPPARPGFGDSAAGLALAGAVGAALLRRALTGEPSVVDGSLLAAGLWQVQPDVVNAGIGVGTPGLDPDRTTAPNPLMLPYRTADGRHVLLMMLAPDRHWPALCEAIGHPELATDPRFADAAARRRHTAACVATLDAIFAGRDLASWRAALADLPGEWAVVQTPAEVHDDPQVRANGYVTAVPTGNGGTLPMVTSPVRFDGRPPAPTRAPEHGEHTEAVLLDLGLGWDAIAALQATGAIP